MSKKALDRVRVIVDLAKEFAQNPNPLLTADQTKFIETLSSDEQHVFQDWVQEFKALHAQVQVHSQAPSQAAPIQSQSPSQPDGSVPGRVNPETSEGAAGSSAFSITDTTNALLRVAKQMAGQAEKEFYAFLETIPLGQTITPHVYNEVITSFKKGKHELRSVLKAHRFPELSADSYAEALILTKGYLCNVFVVETIVGNATLTADDLAHW